MNIFRLISLSLIVIGLSHCSEDNSFRGNSDLNKKETSGAGSGNVEPFATNTESYDKENISPNEELSGEVTITQQASGEINTSEGQTSSDDGKLTCTEAAFLNGASSAAHYCMFASQFGFTGNLGGLAGADSKCTELAEASGLAHTGVTWKAVLSDSTENAKDRIQTDKKIYSTRIDNGTTFAYYLIAEANQLWTSTRAHLIYNEHGTYDPYKEPESYHSNHTWTSTRASGTNTGANCSNWTSNSGAGHVGDASGGVGDTDQWIDGSKATQPCGNRHQIYCISQ